MKKDRIIKLISLTITLIIVGVAFITKNTYSLVSPSEIDEITLAKINEIRSTSNTDISKIDGRIYYVSNDGNDSNDGLTVDTPLKTIKGVSNLFTNKTIKPKDAILFRDGDTFRGNFTISLNEITIGSYGDISLGKPKLLGSTYDYAKEGKWVNVSGNIWKYTMYSKDHAFQYDVGAIWFFCDEGNNNCDRTTTDGKTKYRFGDKKLTYNNVEETEDVIFSKLTKDLDFYHVGHAYGSQKTGGVLYLYSEGNPSTRFDHIEIANGVNGISTGDHHNIVIDNLEMRYYSHHGISIGNVANVTVTNCEIAYIGGMTQKYQEDGRPTRLGNAIQVWGQIKDASGYTVDKGMYVYNNYVYEVYDAGLTFQFTAGTGSASYVDRVEFDNNVVENCSYAIEYWNNTDEYEDTSKTNETLLNKIYFTNNILRKSGIGYTETRPAHVEALIKTWDSWSKTDLSRNQLYYEGEFLIENNILDTTGINPDENGELYGNWMLHITAVDEYSLPTIRHNKFYNYHDRNLGFVFAKDTYKNLVPYNDNLNYNETYLKDNEFYFYDSEDIPTGVKNGKSNDVNWTLDMSTRTLTISGSGRMADYEEGNESPWYQYKDYINTIVIGEDITYIGKRAFYDEGYVQNIYFNGASVNNLASTNMAFYRVGRKSTGTKLFIGENVTKIPYNFMNANTSYDGAPFITRIEFLGNKVTTIEAYSLFALNFDSIVIPDSVTTINKSALSSNSNLKVVALPTNLTVLKENVLKNGPSLESVILGSATTTIEQNALLGATNLNRLVVPNPNFEFPSYTFMDKFSTVGFQVFADPSLKDSFETLKTTCNNDKLYFISTENYRPFVQGDGKNFIVLFDELHYGDSGNYEAKALSNSDVKVTGGKYKFVDRYKHTHYMNGLNIDTTNNSVSNVRMDASLSGEISNTKDVTIEDQNIIFLGNSYLRGFGTQGMSATEKNYDYYYYVTRYLKSMNSNIRTVRTTINRWEEITDQEVKKEKVVELIDEYNSKIDPNLPTKTVFIQLTENINSERKVTFEEDLDYLVTEFEKAYPLAKFYLIYNVAKPADIQQMVVNVAQRHGIETITHGHPNVSGGFNRYQSYVGAKVYKWSRETLYLTEDSHGRHPGDYGFVDIADKFITHLKENNFGKLVEITSNKYQVRNKIIYAKSDTRNYTSDELRNNLNATDPYDIYFKDNMITNNTTIGTGANIKISGYLYKVVLLGDITGDGKISLGDISAIYNHYKGNKILNGVYLEAGLLTGNDRVMIGDVSKLYNFYRGNRDI